MSVNNGMIKEVPSLLADEGPIQLSSLSPPGIHHLKNKSSLYFKSSVAFLLDFPVSTNMKNKYLFFINYQS
jgi:hypothetical protein